MIIYIASLLTLKYVMTCMNQIQNTIMTDDDHAHHDGRQIQPRGHS